MCVTRWKRRLDEGNPGSMALVRFDSTSAVRRTLFERLVMLAAPAVANRILDESLRRARLADVPSGGIELELFVRGPLRDAVEWALGDDFADAFMEDLAPILRKMTATSPNFEDTHIRISAKPSGHATPVAPTPAQDLDEDVGDTIEFELTEGNAETHATARARVVVASRSQARVNEMANALGSMADIQRVEDVFDLVDAAATRGDERIIVVLDSHDSAIRPTTIAAASGELPEDAMVVLWGTAATESDELDAIVPDAEEWLRIGERTSPTELAFFLKFELEKTAR